ncbi:cobalamin B12-binding domain-containing protein [Roseateles depolymerans]|uniref:PpaA n=1 Tax=Roseateles depolymerans TaxID=76731 RepID=A0A0U3CVZ4_9BURK|nr:cobalamin-dependent protein [Roseateles depolymerans]ALV05510.1 PpaA [Roseateles depolymerans]REG14471.1 methanogenic corrinoid protein MtbC1 [Roseateles depolymerans]
MAGWTTNRQAKRPLQRRRADMEAAPDRAVRGAVDALTINALLAARDDSQDGPPARAAPHLDDAAEDQLTRLVEAEIIPRLMLLHRVPSLGAVKPPPRFVPTHAHVLKLSELAVQGDADAAPTYMRGLVAQGATPEQVFLDLLSASARYMGELWEEDRYSFSEVTIGLWRLQRVLHDHAQRDLPMFRGPGASRRCMLAAEPGTQHTFGLSIVAEFFTRGGWQVQCEPMASWHQMKRQLACEHFDVFGLSIASSETIPQIASAILDIRRVSANTKLVVMVGGPMAAQLPDLAQRCGADAMAINAQAAVDLANAWLEADVRHA